MSRINDYLGILEHYDVSQTYWMASKSCLETEMYPAVKDLEILYKTSVTATGPILTAYVLWVLRDAQKRGIDTLYFLSRDGHIMFLIAKELNKAFGFGIHLKYLYVSRIALRKALYCIDKNEAIEIICRDGLHVSLRVAMKRTGLPEEYCIDFLNSLGYSYEEQTVPLTIHGLREFKEQLFLSKEFDEVLYNFSKANCLMIQDYLMQEGLYLSKNWAIVDSGWTGSIQHTLREILQYGKNDSLHINGYYFGIQNPTQPADGTYRCFYFENGKNMVRRYIRFNNNLFECWCSAPHGMTIGYKKQMKQVVPVLKSYTPLWYEEQQEEYILHFTRSFIKIVALQNKDINDIAILEIEPLVVKAMTSPSRLEASVYGKIPFCDDSTEAYYMPLAVKLSLKDILYNSSIGRIINKFCFRNRNRRFVESCWKEGSIALYPSVFTKFLYLDCKLFYLLKILYYCIQS